MLTPLGRDAAQQLPVLISTVLSEQLRGFSADEVATLMRLLQRFIANDAATEALCGGHDGFPGGCDALPESGNP